MKTFSFIGLLLLTGCASGGWHWDAAEHLERSQREGMELRHQLMQQMTQDQKERFVEQQMAFDEREYQHLSNGAGNPFQAFQQGYQSANPAPASVNLNIRGY